MHSTISASSTTPSMKGLKQSSLHRDAICEFSCKLYLKGVRRFVFPVIMNNKLYRLHYLLSFFWDKKNDIVAITFTPMCGKACNFSALDSLKECNFETITIEILTLHDDCTKKNIFDV